MTRHATRGIVFSTLLLAVGCGEDPTAPSVQQSPPALATASAGSLEFLQISAGSFHTCGVTVENVAYCWGSNNRGQIGDGTNDNRFRPTAVAGGHRFSEVTVGVEHSCGVTLAKRVYCWGRNAEGQLGDGSFNDQWTPAAVAGARLFRTVEAGHVHTCAIVNATNRAFCWGDNSFGQLGDGTRGQNRGSPVAVAGGLEWLQLSAGTNFSCGATTGRRAYCWGRNGDGQLGDGTTALRTRPTRVARLVAFRQVSAGAIHSCGVSVSDVTYCWGDNRSGQLGDGTTIRRLRPTPIASQNTWSQVSAGTFLHTCALTQSQRAWCWGNGGSGQLGNGSTTNRLKPALVGDGMPFRQVSAGSNHSCGVARLRQGYCWGENTHGQVGVGAPGKYPEPTQVSNP